MTDHKYTMQAIPLPVRGVPWPTLVVPDPMPAEAFDAMVALIVAMREGIIAPVAPAQDGGP